jgi:HTH-type transcriptional regulator/antitoxin HipB
MMEVFMAQTVRSAKQLGAAVRQARNQKRLSQSELASLISTGQKTISKIENGNPATRIETVFALMAVLELALEVSPRNAAISPNNWQDYL